MTRDYRAVFFDAGYTLLCMEPDQETNFVGACAAESVFIDRSKLRAAIAGAASLLGPRAPNTQARPTTQADHDEFWIAYNRAVLERCARDPRDAARADAVYRRFVARLGWRVYDDVMPVLADLRERGVMLGVISNWTGDLEPTMRDVGLLQHFDFVIDSGVLGHEKPHPPIFAEALRLANVAPRQALHVGDSPDADVEGALALGMSAVLVDRENKYPTFDRAPRVRDLRELLRLL